MVLDTIYASFNASIGRVASYMPQIIGALVIVFLGFVTGKIVGNVGAKVLDKIGVDDAIEKTPIGNIIKTTKMSVVGFMDAIIRWFVYLIFIMAAVDVLNMSMVSNMIGQIVLYLPNLFSGIVILIGGLIVVDVLADWIDSVVKGMNIEGGKQVLLAVRAFMFLIIAILAMDQFLIDTTIIYTFLAPAAWAAAIVIAFRYGVKDTLVAYAKELKRK
ncbi:MAG: hypothetical protein DRN71_04965 [Candidatus Nanohalarchaeota archaeon]|nr:MAG: hypothetical protein DRN71_04965 [Candidatus Nanohaloarchaeota archaeon]